MPKVKYINRKFGGESLQLIELSNQIITSYQSQGYDLTLRQLYYQMVARDVIPNTQQSYSRLGGIINDARLAGMVDWLAITDRTRNLRTNSHWEEPEDIIRSAASSFAIDKWEGQEYRVEVWVEKDALVGVVGRICQELDVPYFSCRGYTSQSEMWLAGRRLKGHIQGGQTPILFHFGDHDPSGKDMSRDIQDRLKLFMGGTEFERLALNMDQIQTYNPPPNPAKITDSRARAYIMEFGEESWELDALEPQVISELISENVLKVRDEVKWGEMVEREEEARGLLASAAENWEIVAEVLRDRL